MRALTTTALLSALSGLAAQEPAAFSIQGSIEPRFSVAGEEIRDLDGDGRDEVLVIGTEGEVRVWRGDALEGALVLEEPDRTLLGLAALGRDSKLHLVAFSPAGMHAYALVDGAYAPEGHLLHRRGRFSMRVGQPVLTNIVQDVNGDGRPDLVLPAQEDCTLFLNGGQAIGSGHDDWPVFQRAGDLQIRISRSAQTEFEYLSDSVASSIRIPDLNTRDVNGDGRMDLVAEEGDRRLFHIQTVEGHFPTQPDVVLDLRIFRDTTPKANVELGRTLAPDLALYNSRDLNSDGIPDYTIAHRRKLWMFLGTEAGPQFEQPSSILKLADDVSFLLPVHLDDDGFPDLLVLKLRAPSTIELFGALIGGLDVELNAVGYPNENGRTFARSPEWKSETTLRLPSILSIVRDADTLVERFQEIGRKFVHVVEADLDGDGADDILIQSEDHKTLQFWRAEKEPGLARDRLEGETRRLLFESENRIWDVDRILSYLESLAEGRTAEFTQGRDPTAVFALRDPEEYRLDFAGAGDLDGDGRAEIVLHYLSLTPDSHSSFDILRMRP